MMSSSMAWVHIGIMSVSTRIEFGYFLCRKHAYLSEMWCPQPSTPLKQSVGSGLRTKFMSSKDYVSSVRDSRRVVMNILFCFVKFSVLCFHVYHGKCFCSDLVSVTIYFKCEKIGRFSLLEADRLYTGGCGRLQFEIDGNNSRLTFERVPLETLE